MTETVRPGWYPDPDLAGGQRYFDDGQWTVHRIGPPAVLPPTPEAFVREAHRRRNVVIGAAVTVVVGAGLLLVGHLAPDSPVGAAAGTACEMQVGTQLRPSVVNSLPAPSVTSKAGVFEVYGSVGAANNTRGQFSSAYHCTVTKTPGGWDVHDVSINTAG
jgi:hypothetical protein